MKFNPRSLVALGSWGMTATMMHPSLTSLIVIVINAGFLSALVYFSTPRAS